MNEVQEMALYLRETSARKSCLSCRHLAKALNMAGFLASVLVEYSLIAIKKLNCALLEA